MALAKERIVDVLKQIVPDKEAEEIVFYLHGKQNISEFIIAEELDLEIHRTRNLLYRLLNVNIVSFKRKKDKIKGWYICYWDFNESAIPHLEEKLRLETIRKLENRLAQEEGGFFYMCRHAHARQNFEDAFENDFKCPECGELMNQQDNARTKSFLQERIAKLKEEQGTFAQERAVILKALSKQAEQELKEAQLAGEAKFDKQTAVRAVKQSTLSSEEKTQRKKDVTKAARQDATAKKKAATKKTTTKKKATTKKTPTKKAATKKTTTKKKATTKTTSSKTPAAKKSTAKKTTTTKKATTKKTTTKKTATKKTPSKGVLASMAKKIGMHK
jgi:transcription initiation factor TFIIE subunit alpha